MTKEYYVSENVQKHHKDEVWFVPADEFIPVDKVQQLLDEVNVLKKSIEKIILPEKQVPHEGVCNE